MSELKYQHLVGLDFEHGKRDCYELLSDFYADNFGIKLTPYARPDDWWAQGLNLYADNFEKEGFRSVEARGRDLLPADVFLIAVKSKVANHCAIHIGGGKILHHFFGRKSEVCLYKGLWRNATLLTIRHVDVQMETVRQTLDLLDIQRKPNAGEVAPAA